MIRFYNKNKEYLENDKKEELKDIKLWNQTELQLKDERATKVAWLIANDTDAGELVTGDLSYYIRFTVKETIPIKVVGRLGRNGLTLSAM